MAKDPYVEMYRDALDATGLPWTVENGSKHKKVFLNGKLAVVLPNARKNVSPGGNQYKKTLNVITRLAEEFKQNSR